LMSQSERRLASIMFTDVVGYTTLSETNEALALSLLEEHNQLLRPIFAKHGGREVKTLGDGFLVEFPSALEAVRCAIEIQVSVHARNVRLPSDKRIQLRVGVHLGDVEHRDGDVYGDAVNIAARIHELADPGGICVTGQVFESIRNSREFRTVPLGRHSLKNVSLPVEAYKVLLPGETAIPTGAPLEPTRIAVIPLDMLSSDQQDEYLADGLTEEVINTLSSIAGLKVIARTSVMKYKGEKKGASEIGRELNVGTVLEGSVMKAGDKIRVIMQMVDAKTDEQVWSQKYDKKLKDVFAMQSDIAKRVADALKVRLEKEQRKLIERKGPENVDAYVLYLRGRYHWGKRNEEDLKRAIGYFEEAIKKEPNYALAFTGLADCHTLMGRHLYMPVDEAFSKARGYAKRALEIDDALAEAHTSMAGIMVYYDWDWRGAEEQFKRAVQLNPSYATAHHWYSLLLFTIGRLNEGVEEAEIAHVLDPLSPVVSMGLVQAYLFAGRVDEAIDECRRHLDMHQELVVAHDFLIHLHVQKGAFGEASREADTLEKLSERKAEAMAHKAYVEAAQGWKGEARKRIEEIDDGPGTEYSNPTVFITVWSILGDNDRAYEWAGRSLEDGKIAFPSLRFSPDLIAFRSDSRYGQLLARAKLA
jgi:adenylate cyclase